MLALALLIGLLLGLIAAFLAVRFSQASSQSTLRSSESLVEMATKMLQVSLDGLAVKEREEARHRMITALVKVTERLDLTVGNLYMLVNNRSVLQTAVQQGEDLPGLPGIRRTPATKDWLPPPAPPDLPEGLVPPMDPNAAGRSVEPAFAAAT